MYISFSLPFSSLFYLFLIIDKVIAPVCELCWKVCAVNIYSLCQRIGKAKPR